MIYSVMKPFSIETLWTDVGFVPNTEQEEAIRHVDGPLYLTAGPGSGKTRVLLWRTLNLIVFHNVHPDEIVLTTFTQKAALQLKEGLQVYLGMASNYTGVQYDLASMFIGTVHSVCQKILRDRRFSEGRKRRKPIKLMDELEQYFYLKRTRIWDRLLVAGNLEVMDINAYFQKTPPKFPNKHKALLDCISMFNRFTEERLNVSKALDIADRNDNLHAILRMYQEYRNSLKDTDSTEICDLPLIQEKALEVIEQYLDASTIFKHVIVDEYQDTNFIQEQLYLKLAGHKNICVVGDDDQALYRFRGSTVENFVEFPARVKKYLGVKTTKVPLSINYRSRQHIVKFYTCFIEQEDWKKGGNPDEQYRVHDKAIKAKSMDSGVAVLTTQIDEPNWIAETAVLCKKLVDKKVVKDPNQIAFLFPSVKNTRARAMIGALRDQGLNVYAPRAGRFLEVPEATELFGIYSHVFGVPDMSKYSGWEFNDYKDWLQKSHNIAAKLIENDADLSLFIKHKNAEIKRVISDFDALLKVARKSEWDLDDIYDMDKMRRKLSTASGLSDHAHRALLSPYLARVVNVRLQDENQQAFKLKQIINRATSLDWSILDLFYQTTGFGHFKKYYDQAQNEGNEASICNLSKITEYLTRFMEMYSPMLSANFLSEQGFARLFFSSYLYTLFRMGESEYEDEDNPFPKGNIPFLTIHQAKGLEFPVVFLYPSRKKGQPSLPERVMRKLKDFDGEPLDKIDSFDTMADVLRWPISSRKIDDYSAN